MNISTIFAHLRIYLYGILISVNALQTIEGLRFLAAEGTPVVVTIHQPDSHVFSLFDNLILMHKGRCIYSGPIEQIQTFFGDRGFNMPHGFNTADWVISVAKTLKTEEDMENKGFIDKDMLLDVEKNKMKDDATGVEQAKPKGLCSSMTDWVISVAKSLKTEEDMENKDFLDEDMLLDVEKNKMKDDATGVEKAKPKGLCSSMTQDSSYKDVFVELTKRQMRNFLRNSKFMILRFSMAIMGGKLHLFSLVCFSLPL